MITKRVNITRQSDKNKHAERGPGDRKRKNSQASCLKSEMFFLLLRFENTFSNLSPLQITFISSSHPCGLVAVGIWKSRVRTSSEHNFLSNYISTMSLIMVYLSSSIGFLVTYM